MIWFYSHAKALRWANAIRSSRINSIIHMENLHKIPDLVSINDDLVCLVSFDSIINIMSIVNKRASMHRYHLYVIRIRVWHRWIKNYLSHHMQCHLMIELALLSLGTNDSCMTCDPMMPKCALIRFTFAYSAHAPIDDFLWHFSIYTHCHCHRHQVNKLWSHDGCCVDPWNHLNFFNPFYHILESGPMNRATERMLSIFFCPQRHGYLLFLIHIYATHTHTHKLRRIICMWMNVNIQSESDDEPSSNETSKQIHE